MRYRFNPPPDWPPPPRPDWTPPDDWTPPPQWPVPEGWRLWVPDEPSVWKHPFVIASYILAPILIFLLGFAGGVRYTPVAASSPSATPKESTPTGSPKKTEPTKTRTEPTRTKARGIPASATGPHRVSKIGDGDTIHVDYRGRDTTVQLIGVDAPQTAATARQAECFGQRASKRARTLLEGHRVYVATDPALGRRDQRGRLVAYLWRPGGKFVNADLLRLGYAHERSYAERYEYQQRFRRAERRARAADRGLWAADTCDGRRQRPEPEPTEPTEPEPKRPKTTQPPAYDGLDPRFDTCAEANDHGYGPYVKGVNPEYDWYIDADSDGIVCER